MENICQENVSKLSTISLFTSGLRVSRVARELNAPLW